MRCPPWGCQYRAALARRACANGLRGLHLRSMQLFVVGMSYRTAPIEMRERFASCPDRRQDISRALAKTAGVSETLAFSTCNRFEILLVAPSSLEGTAIVSTIEKLCGSQLSQVSWYVHAGEAAILHLFRVAAGLDALAVGETQVLGQLKMAYQRAWEAGTTGPVLNRTLHRAFFVAKRIHTEAGMAEAPVSVASIAAVHAARLVGNPAAAQAVVVGTGEMGTIAARGLLREGFVHVGVSGRRMEHASCKAREIGAAILPWNEFPRAIASARILISATSAKRPIIGRRLVQSARTGINADPLHIIDLGVPRNVAPSVRGLPGVTVITIDDLGDAAETNRKIRLAASRKAEQLVGEETERFFTELSGRRFAETVSALSKKFSDIRQRELGRLFKTLPGLSKRERQTIETACDSIVAKILRDPAIFLKDEAHGEEDRFMSADMLRRVFKL